MSDEGGARFRGWLATQNARIEDYKARELPGFLTDLEALLDQIGGWLAEDDIPHERVRVRVRETDALTYEAPAIEIPLGPTIAPAVSLIVGSPRGRVDIGYQGHAVHLLRFCEDGKAVWRVSSPRRRAWDFAMPGLDRGPAPRLTKRRLFAALCEVVEI